MELKKPQQPGRVPGSPKSAELLLPEAGFNAGTLEQRAPWEWPLPVDYRALVAPITFMEQRLRVAVLLSTVRQLSRVSHALWRGESSRTVPPGKWETSSWERVGPALRSP